MKLALSEITADQRAQPRAKMDGDVLKEYGEDMKRGDKFPLAVVFFDGKKHWLADGFHRYYACPEAEREKLDCDIRQGGLDEAIEFSCGANAAHGSRRTNEDKRRAVMRLMQLPKFQNASDQAIAEKCALTNQFVGKVRKELALSLPPVGSDTRKYRDKHGNLSTMNVANIGKRPAEEGVFVAKSLHEIERHLDMMPAPNEAIEIFPEDQRFRFPPSKIDEMAEWLTAFAAGYRASFPRAAE